MPPLTAEALRAAVAQIIPSRVPELNDHMATAITQAKENDSTAPLRTFLIRWGTTIAIERHPSRSERMRECERIVRDSDDSLARQAAISEIGQILDTARQEIGQ